MTLTLVDYIIIVGGGFLAGVINTLAGFGSIITLTLLMEVMGLPGIIANATNRVNIGMMNASSTFSFYTNGKLKLKGTSIFLVALVIGAIIGLILVSQVSNEQFREIFKYLLILFIPIILFKPSRLINSDDAIFSLPKPIILILFFLAGLYGGFIQMGIGVFILLLTVSITKLDLIESNAFKVASIGVYTLVAIIVFQLQGLIVWKAGLLIGVAQALGGYVTAKFASINSNANKWAYRMLIVVLVLAILRIFEVF